MKVEIQEMNILIYGFHQVARNLPADSILADYFVDDHYCHQYLRNNFTLIFQHPYIQSLHKKQRKKVRCLIGMFYCMKEKLVNELLPAQLERNILYAKSQLSENNCLNPSLGLPEKAEQVFYSYIYSIPIVQDSVYSDTTDFINQMITDQVINKTPSRKKAIHDPLINQIRSKNKNLKAMLSALLSDTKTRHTFDFNLFDIQCSQINKLINMPNFESWLVLESVLTVSQLARIAQKNTIVASNVDLNRDYLIQFTELNADIKTKMNRKCDIDDVEILALMCIKNTYIEDKTNKNNLMRTLMDIKFSSRAEKYLSETVFKHGQHGDTKSFSNQINVVSEKEREVNNLQDSIFVTYSDRDLREVVTVLKEWYEAAVLVINQPHLYITEPMVINFSPTLLFAKSVRIKVFYDNGLYVGTVLSDQNESIWSSSNLCELPDNPKWQIINIIAVANLADIVGEKKFVESAKGKNLNYSQYNPKTVDKMKNRAKAQYQLRNTIPSRKKHMSDNVIFVPGYERRLAPGQSRGDLVDIWYQFITGKHPSSLKSGYTFVRPFYRNKDGNKELSLPEVIASGKYAALSNPVFSIIERLLSNNLQ